MTTASRFGRISKWLTTIQGRTTVGYVFGTGVFAAYGVEYLPQTFFLKHYLNFVALQKHDAPLPLTDDLKKLWTQVETDLNLDIYEKTLPTPFMVFGFDIWHAGSFKTRFGSIIGLPINFTYKSSEDIDKAALVVNNEPVNWSRDDAKELLKSLVLSDDAKKHAIAREIVMCGNQFLIIQSGITPLTMMGAYFTASALNDKFKLFIERSRSVRGIMYLLVGTFFWGIWAAQRDGYFRYLEHDTDEELSKLGKNYLRGGVEFYDQTLKRNVALRSLLGKSGESAFTMDGNENNFFRHKHLPLTYRKQYFESKLKELENLDQ